MKERIYAWESHREQYPSKLECASAEGTTRPSWLLTVSDEGGQMDVDSLLIHVYVDTLGRPPEELRHANVRSSGITLPGVFDITSLATAVVASVNLSASMLHHARGQHHGGTPGRVTLDDEEALSSFLSERYLLINGNQQHDLFAPMSGNYKTRDENHPIVRLHCNFKVHQDAALQALGLPLDASKADVQKAISVMLKEDVVKMVESKGGCSAALRSLPEWKAHSLYNAMAASALIAFQERNACLVRPLPALIKSKFPLSGIKVLDVTRVLAGPVCCRILSALGAEVLHVSSSSLPGLPGVDPGTLLGKRSCHIDLKTAAGCERFRALVKECDVLVQAYRPGSLDTLGFGLGELSRINPSIVTASISAYGVPGDFSMTSSWARRRGFDSNVQLEAGLSSEEADAIGESGSSVALSCQALDHATGWLAALGIIEGLRRRMDGRPTHSQMSLVRTAMLLESLRKPKGVFPLKILQPDDIKIMVERHFVKLPMTGGDGDVITVKYPGTIDGAEVGWKVGPPTSLGIHPPCFDNDTV